jgi:hypothetical protein
LQALNELEYPDKLQKLLLTPNREMGVELVVQMDSGEIEVFNAYRSAPGRRAQDQGIHNLQPELQPAQVDPA